MFMSISVGIGFSVGFNFQPQQAEAADSENVDTNIENQNSLTQINHYFSTEINESASIPITGENINDTSEYSEYKGYGKIYKAVIFDQNDGLYKIKIELNSGIKINGYVIHFFDTVDRIRPVTNLITNTEIDTKTEEITFDSAGWKGISVFWGEEAVVKYGFYDGNNSIDYNVSNTHGSYNGTEIGNGNVYTVSVSAGAGKMLHSIEWVYKSDNAISNSDDVVYPSENRIVWDDKSENLTENPSSLKRENGSKYSTIEITGFSKFPKYLRIVFRESNEISFDLLVSTDPNTRHHSVLEPSPNGFQSVYTGSTGFSVGEINNNIYSEKQITIGDMEEIKIGPKVYNHELGLFAIGLKYKIYYKNKSQQKVYLTVTGSNDNEIVLYEDGFKASSDLEKYKYVNVKLTTNDLKDNLNNQGYIELYLEESGTEVGLNAHAMSDKLTSLGQYESSNFGGKIEISTNSNIYNVSANYSQGYDFSARIIDTKNVGYVTFFPSEILNSSDIGKQDSKSVFAVSMDKAGSDGNYSLKAHGSSRPLKEENKENGFVYYDNIFTAFIYYTMNAYDEAGNEGQFIMNLPDDYKIEVYCYFSLQQFQFNGLNVVDDKVVEDKNEEEMLNKEFSFSNKVKVTYNLPNNGGEVIMFESDFKKDLKVYYGATVSLSLMDGKEFRFVGLYYSNETEDKLISVPSQIEEISGNIVYNYEFDFTTNKPLNLKAKYVSYSVTDKRIYPTNRVYSISSAEDLIWLSNSVLNGNTFEGYIVKQTGNIVFSDDENLHPIGTVKTPFKGVYDGNNYTISNLKFFAVDDYTLNLKNVGLFGCTENATIKNVNIVSNGNGLVKGLSNVGGIVGYAKGTKFKFVRNFNLNVDLKNNGQYIPVELFDFKKEILKNSNVTLVNPEMNNFGGIVGLAENCSFTAVSCSANVLAGGNMETSGGIVGFAKNCNLDKCVYDKSQANSMSEIDLKLLNCDAKSVVSNCCVYKDQQTNIYYTTVKNVLYFGEIQSSDDKLSVNINGTENELSNDIWFILNGRTELKIFYWGY